MTRTRSNFLRDRFLRMFAAACLSALILSPAIAPAQEEAEEAVPEAAQKAAPKLSGKVVFQSIDNPTGLAIQPGTNHVLVAARPAVYRLIPGEGDEYGTAHAVVHGYPTDVYGKGPMFDIGPLGLAFLSPKQLVVGDGSRKDGEEVARVYEVGQQGETSAQSQLETKAQHTLGPIVMQEGVTATGEGNFYGVAVGANTIFFSCNGDDTKGWVARAKVENGVPGKFEPFIATKEKVEVDAPIALTMDPEGKLLVVGQGGEVNIPGDSLLTMYDPESGELVKKLATGLNDITGLAYHPKTGKLYAVDFSWMEPSKGGLFRLDVEDDKVTAVRLLDLDKPTALAFDGDGRLYVSVFGTQAEVAGAEEKEGEGAQQQEEVKEVNRAKPAGQVLLIEGELP